MEYVYMQMCLSRRMILKTAVSPRKARKTRNKSVRSIDLAIHPLGDGQQFGISLKILVLFVFFVDEMIFLGLMIHLRCYVALDSPSLQSPLKIVYPKFSR